MTKIYTVILKFNVYLINKRKQMTYLIFIVLKNKNYRGCNLYRKCIDYLKFYLYFCLLFTKNFLNYNIK